MKDEIISIVSMAPDKIKSRDIATELGENNVTDEIRQAIATLVAEGTLIRYGMYLGINEQGCSYTMDNNPNKRERLPTDIASEENNKDRIAIDGKANKARGTGETIAPNWPSIATSNKPGEKVKIKRPPGIKTRKHKTSGRNNDMSQAAKIQDNASVSDRDARIKDAIRRLKRKALQKQQKPRRVDMLADKLEALDVVQDIETGLFDLFESVKEDLQYLHNMARESEDD